MKQKLKEWIAKVLDDSIPKEVSASFDIPVGDYSAIFARKVGKVLVVSGYYFAFNDVAQDAQVAHVDSSSIIQSFASPVTDSGNTTRLKLERNGTIVCERAHTAYQWVSFSFTTIVGGYSIAHLFQGLQPFSRLGVA